MTSDINDKFSEILSSITALTHKVVSLNSNLEAKVDKLVSKLDKFDKRLNELEEQCKSKLEQLDDNLDEKTDNCELEELRAAVQKLEKSKQEHDKMEVMRESYDKRFNVLNYGLPEDPQNVWETPLQTLAHIHKFMKEALLITDPTMINLADYHRLPQRPIYKEKLRVDRPIIIKLTNGADKRRIFANLKYLKTFNETRREQKQRPAYVTEHLPKQFQDKRKLLLPFFNEARKRKQKTMRKPVDGHYALYIDGNKVELPSVD